MSGRWNSIGLEISYTFLLINFSIIQGSLSINDEGSALLAFRARITADPRGFLADWNPNNVDPCKWSGVHCADGKVEILDLSNLSLEGTLSPELGKLGHLKYLILIKNHFSGTIPCEIGMIKELEKLDLRENNLLINGNKFEGSIPLELERLNFDESPKLSWNSGLGYVNRKLGHWFKFGEKYFHGREKGCCNNLPSYSDILVMAGRRKLLEESRNLHAMETSIGSFNREIISQPITRSSGTFPAVRNKTESKSPSPIPSPFDTSHKTSQPSGEISQSPQDFKGNLLKYVTTGAGVAFFLIIASVIFCMCRSRGVTAIGPWKTGLSGQLQKAFITGAPKLNRPELETACEDFSNIIDTFSCCTVYKGTLSSGVEIAVASTSITSLKDWSNNAEMTYRKKIDTLSRVNHKNFVNLLGYCEVDQPFTRMMVFEYAPNGTLFEHLHVKEVGHLDWSARMRIIMGTAYCLQYMHHDLKPPVAHSSLASSSIYLTDDYAAKIVEVSFDAQTGRNSKNSSLHESEQSLLPLMTDPETNIYDFGTLLLEIISGKLPFSEEQGHLVNWAAEFLNDKRKISYMIDQSLKSFKNNELYVICEVILDCITLDPMMRPTMKDITAKLRAVIGLSPDQAVPRLSPLWWAELEILSVEAT